MIYIGKKEKKYYKNILMMVDLGMHEQIYAELSKLVPQGAKILDLGCGEGALSQRLVDHGYKVFSVDKNPSYFKCVGSTFIEVDFDKPGQLDAFIAQHEESFDAVIGIEVIEHVENQWDYVRGLRRMCKTGGHLFVSTPNTQSWLSRLQFLRSGRFHQFSDPDLEYGHISPLTLWEADVIFRALHLTKIKSVGVGTLPPLYFTSAKTVAASLLGLMLRPFMQGQIEGWCVLSICRK
jgi:cyclopropane fatty-acyl-phospholipid synthase-like methyltransferase